MGVSASLTRFFAPSFFSPYYFPASGISDAATLDTEVTTYRDRDAFRAVVAALASTGEFAEVFFATTSDRRFGGADRTPAVSITPNDWEEMDDVDPTVIVRRVSFILTIVNRSDDPLTRYDSLDRLSCIAQNAINGSDLGGGSLRAMTRLRRGRFDRSAEHPEQSVILLGEFTYLVPAVPGHSFIK
ncbi:MAG: hypothetical protein NVSMB9_01340 [Isosphaeraceae bacterium]